jgi:hypothetical protein
MIVRESDRCENCETGTQGMHGIGELFGCSPRTGRVRNRPGGGRGYKDHADKQGGDEPCGRHDEVLDR